MESTHRGSPMYLGAVKLAGAASAPPCAIMHASVYSLSDGVLEDGTGTGMDAGINLAVTRLSGYGYQWWLDGTGAYQASGIFGQMIKWRPINKP